MSRCGFWGGVYDLSGHNPLKPIPISVPESLPNESAAKAAGVEPGSTECDVAVRYLLNQSYIKEADAPPKYVITVQGIDRVRDVGCSDSWWSPGICGAGTCWTTFCSYSGFSSSGCSPKWVVAPALEQIHLSA
jgi:hypothetical protein